ncbi:DUF1573 domain-containing protein [bacterium]|nr:DUF1573 domain-containing protein [bacterium]
MKQIVLLLAVIVGLGTIGFTNAQKIEISQDAMSKIEFEKKTHDFGEFEEGIQATTVFKFKNTGNAPLVLNAVTPSCGCTSPSWTKEPVAPGEEGEIKVVYNSKGRPGQFTKTITVKHNGEGGTVFLNIRGVVKKAEVAPEPTVKSPEN